MSDRHLHCVYYQFDNSNMQGGHCLLHNKVIPLGFAHCCDSIVLRPSEVLTYYLRHDDIVADWSEANHAANRYIEHIGLNNYPRKREENRK